MWEHERATQILRRNAVRLAVSGVGEEEGPRGTGVALRHLSGVEPLNPGGERVGVVPTRGERPVRCGPPERRSWGAANWQNRAAVLARHGEDAGARVRRPDPVDERGATKPCG